MLALTTSTVPVSLTRQDPGKGWGWGVKKGEQDRTGGKEAESQALTGLGLKLILWFPSQPLLLSAASCFSKSGEANFLQWPI